MNNRSDLLLWLSDVFNAPIIPDDILMSNEEKLGFRPQLTFSDGHVVSVHKVPHTSIKKKYRLVSTEVPIYYYDNIKLIRKLEKFLDVPFIMSVEQDKWNALINVSNIRFDSNTKTTTFEEDYSLHLLVKHGDYQIINIKEPFFFNTLDDLLTKTYVSMLLDKKFSELSKKEMAMVKIYHYK